MSNPLPGWYPDPESPGRQRFWDGQQWTEARAYPAAEVGATSRAQTPSGGSSGGPWPWVALVAILAAILLAGAYFISRPDSGDKTPTPTSTTETATATTTETATVTPTPPPTGP